MSYFNRVEGHEIQKKILAEAVRTGKVSHSYLFQGTRGIGKKLIALGFAAALNCESRENSPVRSSVDCTCTSCQKISRSSHPDVQVLDFPDEKNIRIDHIRDEVEKNVYLSPYEGRYKVFIVDNAERMNVNAQNAFLKTLEEPPANCVIVLITDASHLFLSTIISRCQILNFHPLEKEIVKKYLEANSPLSEEQIEAAAMASGGSIGRAVRIDSEYLNFRRKILECILNEDSSLYHVTQLVEKLDKDHNIGNNDTLGNIFEVLVQWIRQVMMVKACNPEAINADSNLFESLSVYAGNNTIHDISDKAALIEKTWFETTKLNSNRKLALENLLVNLVN